MALWRRVERECERLVDALEIPEGIRDLRDLCDLVGDRLGQGIELEDMPTRPLRYRGLPLCGLTLVGADGRTTIYVERSTTWRHRLVIGTHELGHLALGHEPSSCEEVLGLDTTDRAFTRSHFSRPAERAAEVFGALLTERAMTPAPGLPGASAPTQLSRVEQSLLPTRRRRRVWR